MTAPSSRKQPLSKLDLALIDDIGTFYADPLGFVRYVFPWGEPGALKEETGPDEWQTTVLNDIGDRVLAGDSVETAIQIAVASGHGIGKSALVAWIILWFMSTRDFPQIVVTANTQSQLTTKTWRELSRWHNFAINKHWFQWTATRFQHTYYPETWFAAAIPWSEHNSEAFAGTHEKHVLVIFDEASAVADKIWEVTEGAMTTKGAMWVAFGNPTQNTGRFAACFGALKHRWITHQIDSRTAKMANKAQIQNWIDDYGEDSDFVKVRVRGVFPSAGSLQFIGSDLVTGAMSRKAEGQGSFARVFGVDVARHGDDQSVIVVRQGNQVDKVERFREPNLMRLADIVAMRIHELKPDAVFVDATGMGWGVIDRLRQLNFGDLVMPVQVGEAAMDKSRYVLKRDELWGKCKEWLAEGGACLPKDPELESDLTAPQYGYDNKMRIKIETKDDMKKRGLSSPDSADALNLTFASPIANRTAHKTESWRDKLGVSRKRGSAMAA